jgi:hypothetical protein
MTPARAPKMLPGQDPYTPEELEALYRLVGEAAEEDPGELDEDAYLLPRPTERTKQAQTPEDS